ncbi:MAG: efflux RND transporter periplasmic adaptor subunit, partial [Undibacterium sp.]|nr:efflux RND transporter periplasmic adaptor subunit [Undibacterium sp.]
MKKSKTIVVIALLLASAGTYLAWKKFGTPSTDAPATVGLGSQIGGNKNQVVSVSTVLAQKRDYEVKLTANGVVTALNTVEVRPQVASVIAKVHIKEGQFVHAGDVLFTLDNRNDSVNVAKAQAQLDKELASLAENQRQLLRSKELFERKFQSQSAVDASQTLVQAQQAVVDAAKAALASSKVSLGFNRIVAPSAG